MTIRTKYVAVFIEIRDFEMPLVNEGEKGP
jgi:hypothetical protein